MVHFRAMITIEHCYKSPSWKLNPLVSLLLLLLDCYSIFKWHLCLSLSFFSLFSCVCQPKINKYDDDDMATKMSTKLSLALLHSIVCYRCDWLFGVVRCDWLLSVWCAVIGCCQCDALWLAVISVVHCDWLLSVWWTVIGCYQCGALWLAVISVIRCDWLLSVLCAVIGCVSCTGCCRQSEQWSSWNAPSCEHRCHTLTRTSDVLSALNNCVRYSLPEELWSYTPIELSLASSLAQRVVWWRNGSASDFRPRGHGFDPRSGCSYVTTLGKLFTPTCLDADSLSHYMESLNRVPLPLV